MSQKEPALPGGWENNMKKTVIINIPMTVNVQNIVYTSRDASLPASERAVGYPVLSFLERTLQKEDEVRFILIAKYSMYSRSEQRIAEFQEQFAAINQEIGAAVSYEILRSEFEQSRDVHEQLMEAIVNKIEVGAQVIADITYGPKDLPIVVFTALNFAEHFLNCSIDHIIYGQGVFNDEGKLEETEICDLSPLYALNTLTGMIRCKDPQKSKEILHSVISL